MQEKCREQNDPLYLAFIDLTKAFDIVTRDGLFNMLPLIGSLPKLLSLVKSFHDSMMRTMQFNGDISDEFGVKSGVKQGCVLAPTLFGIFFVLLLKHAFRSSNDDVYLHTRSDGRLFNIAGSRSKTKTLEGAIRDLPLPDDAAIVSHTQGGTTEISGQFPQCLQSVPFDHQSKENSGHGPSNSDSTHYYHQWGKSGSRQPIPVPGLNSIRHLIT